MSNCRAPLGQILLFESREWRSTLKELIDGFLLEVLLAVLIEDLDELLLALHALAHIKDVDLGVILALCVYRILVMALM